MHIALIAFVSDIKEPPSYKQAFLQLNWVEAMQKEIQALNNNHTWSVTALPLGNGCKWVYEVKLKVDGSLEWCKAIIVAQHCTLKYGVDDLEDKTISHMSKFLLSNVSLLLQLVKVGQSSN